MKKLFLVDGAAGIVKKDLIQYINSKERSCVVQKFTTRPERNTDSKNIDLVFVSEERFCEIESNEECYCYNYGKEGDGYGEARYGVPKRNLDKAIEQFENIFVIVRDWECTCAIMSYYQDIVKVIPILIYSDKQFTSERLKEEGIDNNDILARINRINEVLDDYFCELKFFDRLILLNDASKEHLKMQINQLIMYSDMEPYDELCVTPQTSYQLIRPLIGYKENMLAKLKENPFKKNIFIMMKFRDDDRDGYTNTEIYKLIRDIIEGAGYNCVRADQEEWTHLADESSYNPLAVSYCCKYGIALIDEPEKEAAYNSNVIYELGMMATQNKKCILLRDENVESIPFDLITTIHRTYSMHSYEKDIRNHLKSWLKDISMS